MTYDEVAERFEVKRCEACDRYNHKTGAWLVTSKREFGPPPKFDAERRTYPAPKRVLDVTIHWADRKMTRAGLRRFLMLIYDAQHIFDPMRERWYRRWRASVWAASIARKEFHIGLPKRLSDADRAYVWAHIQTTQDVPAACRAWAKPKEITNG